MQFPEITAPYCIALEKSVGAVIFRDVSDGNKSTREYLLLQYPHGHWEFPRGHVEEGESEKETALRETEEETGIHASDLTIQEGFRESFSFGYRARGGEKKSRIKQKKCLLIRKKAVFYIAELAANAKPIETSHEHSDHAWLTYNKAQKKLTHTNAKKLLKKVSKHLDHLHSL